VAKVRPRYDKDAVKSRAADIAFHYLGAGEREADTRIYWRCPACTDGGRIALRIEDNRFGCFKADCELGGSADIITFIAYMENLNQQSNFLEVLAKAYDILGLDHSRKDAGNASKAGKLVSSTPTIVSTAANASRPSEEEREALFGLCHEVFSRVMQISVLEKRDRAYLRKRGLSHDTILAGRFGSMSRQRAEYLVDYLREEFGDERLLRVPGFFEDSRADRFGFTLAGEYLLIPYFDSAGRVTNIEGRRLGDVPKGKGKYVALRNSGNHLYIFPPLASRPEALEAFTEGCFGAIVAAQSGVAVGSIQGCKRFKATSSMRSPFAKRSENDDSLHELTGVNFRGRAIPYIPDADEPPNKDVLHAAPKAAEYLIDRHGGEAMLCSLPSGLDLDEWLLSIPADQRRRAFSNLLSESVPLEEAERWMKSRLHPKTRPKKSKRKRKSDPHGETATSGKLTEAASDDASKAGGGEDGSGLSAADRVMRHEVYAAMLEGAPLKDGHRKALMKLGVLERTTTTGMLGSLGGEGAKRVSAELESRFGSETLLSVPGFERAGHGGVVVGLPEENEYVLLPCLDNDAYITAIEAVACDSEHAEIPFPVQTTTLADEAPHLYVFAPYAPEDMEGVCEEPIAALLAAQDDVILGAVVNLPRSSPARGRKASALPELSGVDLGGRPMPCATGKAPHDNVPADRAVWAEVRRSITQRNGKPNSVPLPAIAERRHLSEDAKGANAPPSNSPEIRRAPSTLLNFILSIPEESRHEKLRELFPENPRRARSEPDAAPEDRTSKLPEPPTATELSLAAVVAIAVSMLVHTTLRRLESFGDYVGVGYGGLPFVKGGLSGFLRMLASSAPMDALYDNRLLSSVLAGILAAVAVFALLRGISTRRRRYESLSRFNEGEWRAHLVEEERPSRMIVRPGEAFEAAVSCVAAFFALGLLERVFSTLLEKAETAGLEVGAFSVAAVEPGRMTMYGAVLFGLFVLWRRVSARRQLARIVEGGI
jgi:hypothetical protein